MRCIVTAGPSYEPLDEVRRLTNFSTGRLGTELAGHLSRAGHDVTLLRGALATFLERPVGVEVRPFMTTRSLGSQLEGFATSERVAIFHAAAVSDFGFGAVFERDASGELVRVIEGKISTRRGPLLVELTPTPKLIRSLRDWFPSALLVGWKYEVEGSRDDAMAAGRGQLDDSRTDACVVNGPAYGAGFGLMHGSGEVTSCTSSRELFESLATLLQVD